MIIQYEIGDFVYCEYGGQPFKVVGLRTHGLVLEDDEGQRFFAGKHRISPSARTVANATKITKKES